MYYIFCLQIIHKAIKTMDEKLGKIKKTVRNTERIVQIQENKHAAQVGSVKALVHKVLPIGDITSLAHEATINRFFGSPAVAQLLLEIVKATMNIGRTVRPNIDDVTKITLQLCFGLELRAHLFWGDNISVT